MTETQESLAISDKGFPFEITRHDIPILQLPASFQGFTLVQISDLHIDRWNREIVEAAIPVVNALKADLLVCTGDTIAAGHHFLPDLTALLRRMEAAQGKAACLGNHDYSDGSQSQGVRKALGLAGFEVLVNQSAVITLNNQRINVAGADDLILGRQCLTRTTQNLLKESPTILLSHNPHNFGSMADFEPDLVLSGHTHGGQIRLPRRVHKLFTRSPYLAGHYRHRESMLYVNRGLGTSVFIHHLMKRRVSVPTPRFFVRPEISVFRLVRAQAASTDAETRPKTQGERVTLPA